ncbi:MAG TPA: beta-propeller fold lactonase family protein [Terriglobales bacterium]|nr:beta-propeller fold lactonase family protein [Terriglobales bacterium]
MSKKTGGVAALVALCGLSLFLLNCGSTVSRSSGLLYVLSQGSSDVSSYAINLSSGNLSLINSNAKTENTPSSIILDPAGTVAFVLNAGSGDITGYTIGKDGSLSPSSGTTAITVQNPIAMTRDAAGTFLFVVSQGSIPPPSNCPLPEPDATCPHLSVFSMQSGSTSLSLASQTSLPRVPTGIAATAGPNSTVLLYVTSNLDLIGTNDNTVSEYSVDPSGNVAEQAGSPYTTASNPSAVVAVTTSPIGGSGGLFVYLANVTTNSVSVFQVCTVQTATCTQQNVTDLTLLPVGTPSTVGSEPVAMVVDPKSQFLFVASKNSNQVFGFRINATQGTLSALNPANVSTGSAPIALAMHSSGKFLYVSNNASSNISGFNVDTTSGAMSSPITITSLGNPAGLVSK